jgi:hypothetical protein
MAPAMTKTRSRKRRSGRIGSAARRPPLDPHERGEQDYRRDGERH